MSEIRSNITDDDAWKYRMQRVRGDANISSYASPGAKPEEITSTFDRLIAAEDEIAPSGNYEKGAASHSDEVLVIDGDKDALLTP